MQFSAQSQRDVTAYIACGQAGRNCLLAGSLRTLEVPNTTSSTICPIRNLQHKSHRGDDGLKAADVICTALAALLEAMWGETGAG
jgi:hypothetical protein